MRLSGQGPLQKQRSDTEEHWGKKTWRDQGGNPGTGLGSTENLWNLFTSEEVKGSGLDAFGFKPH